MECPFCKGCFEVSVKEQKFCLLCGTGFSPEFVEELRNIVPPAMNGFKAPPNFSTAKLTPPSQGSSTPYFSPSFDTDDFLADKTVPPVSAEDECTTLLHRIFSCGRFSPEERLALARRKWSLGIQPRDAIDIQKSVARKLDFRLTNISGSSEFLCFQEERTLDDLDGTGKMAASGQDALDGKGALVGRGVESTGSTWGASFPSRHKIIAEAKTGGMGVVYKGNKE